MNVLLHTHDHHNLWLVFLSYVIATISAYASIDLARRVKYSEKKARLAWLLSGAAVLGIGIWSMHFVAMLGYHFPNPVYYDQVLVILSVIVVIFGCFLGFSIVSRRTFTITRFVSSGTIMGLGIASMHYIGMEAIKPMIITYDKTLFAASIFIAVFASMAALWIGFFYPYSKHEMSRKLKIVFSLIMAIAITGMHFTGMSAAEYSTDPAAGASIPSHMIKTDLLVWIVAIVTFIIFIIFFFSITFERMWRKQEVVHDTILDSAEDGIVVTNKDGFILHANPAFYRLFNSTAAAKGLFLLEEFHPQLTKGAEYNKEFRITVGTRTIEVNKHTIQEDGINDSLWFLRDITEKIEAEQSIEFMAYHDPLTLLPNRHKLENGLDGWIKSGMEVACIYLDLDRLKFTNDTLGHEAGDTLLKYVSKRLQKLMQKNDLLARIGGDEFVILLVDDRARDAYEIAKSCVDEMNVPYSINGINVRVTVSAGICSYPKDAKTAEELLRYADLAMYASKRNGKNQVTMFNIAIKSQIVRAAQLEEALWTAVEQKQFSLVYQPKVGVASGKVEGVEALLRWKHPTLGNISPVEFIQIAEERGMIYEIGDWVLEKACSQWVQWKEEGMQPITVAVNISPLQFSKDDFLQKLKKAIEITGMDPHYLELELTESASMAFEDQAKGKFQEIRSMGVKISLDDFGTGYSSFKYLKELPIEVLKIDKSFVDHLIGNAGQEAIVRSMIQLGHNLNLQVLVEGVESKGQVDWLKKEGCDIIQGYFYSKPVQQAVIWDMLESVGQPE
ncbi:EAL domain-containing protein [Bacillus sp. FJAT-49711]|uniref:bifunctional diguanylate cyclase/phosphodiesterase n=1 Tax=Bacillus sp. FJAT-49711 TaxID=2833585 RepID=UPI001BC9D98D|nr:EAL domain-containing protein [Bacillus sp. FJAT-49711]MBS4219025.1 EAL domain-containing protein [Bacillus sp. FJAT-49711]